MKQLSVNWFVEPLFDFEYKTYEVLAYAKSVTDQFAQHRFYPYIDEVVQHKALLDGFIHAKASVEGKLRSDLIELDLDHLRLIREQLPDSSGLIRELDSILHFASRTFTKLQSAGMDQLASLSEKVEITPVGIQVSAEHPGFLFFRKGSSVRIYSYRFRLVRRPYSAGAYKDVCTQYLSELSTHQFTNYSHIKWDLIKSQKSFASTALNAYLVETSANLPQHETLIPLAKQFLIKAVA
jgi:hypothetical protein